MTLVIVFPGAAVNQKMVSLAISVMRVEHTLQTLSHHKTQMCMESETKKII